MPGSRRRNAIKDPLLEFARAANARSARVPAHAHEMLGWTTPLFESEDPEDAPRYARPRHFSLISAGGVIPMTAPAAPSTRC